jgi:rubrerythrin
MNERLLKTFGLAARAAARKKVYGARAAAQGRMDLARLLRAMAASEGVQARRLANSLRGSIDMSDEYIATIFEQEVPSLIAAYAEALEKAGPDEKPSLRLVYSQLRAAEKRIAAFYAKERRDIRDESVEKYHVCQFCGYIAAEKAPEKCPICGAAPSGFRETG